jgi:hypothetical protein
MANMNVSMTLSLVDTASPQVKAFMEQLTALESVVAGVGSKLASMASGMEAFASSLGLVRTNAVAASESIATVGASAGTASAETAKLGTTIASLEAALQGVVGRLAGVTAGLTEMGAAAVAVSSGAGTAMNTIGTGAQAATTHVNTLADSLKGMALLWSAFEMKKGMTAGVREASDFQREMTNVAGLNLGDAANKEIAEKAWQDSRNLRNVSPLEALRARQAAIGGLAEPMNQDVLDGTITSALKLATNLRAGGDKTDLADMIRNLYGIAEARQQTEDVPAMLRTFDLVQKAFLATQGKVTPKDLEMFVRQLGQGASNISDDGLMRAIAAIDQMKIAGGANGGGGGASKYGTAYKMLQAYAMGKPMNKQGAAMLIESGILAPGAIDEDGNTTLSANIKPGAAKDQMLASQDINAWIEKIAPNIIAYTRKHAKEYYQGKDMDDPKAIEAAVQKYLTALGITVTAQQAASFPLNPRSQARMEEQRKMQQDANGVNEQWDKIKENFDQSTARFHTAMETLGQAIGTVLLPVLKTVIDYFSKFVEWVAGLAHDNAAVAWFLTLAGGVSAVAAAVVGFIKIFGPIGKLLGIGAESFAFFGTAATVARTAIGLAARGILAALGPLGVIITVIVAAWESGLVDWISKLNVFGRSVGDWSTIISDRVVTDFKNMWLRTKEFFGFISKDAADAQVEANNRAHLHKIVQMGTPGAKPATRGVRGGASGDWEDAPTTKPSITTSGKPKTRAEQILEQQLADAENAASGPKVVPKPKRGRFANYDANLDDAKNDLRLEEDELARHMKAEDELYKAGKLSIDEYYDDKLATMRKSVNAQIAELEREKAAYKRQGDKAGVNRAETEITLRKRDLSDNEKSVEVQREKDLNVLKEKGLQLDAQQLQAEGKKNQATLAREVQRLKKDQEEYLRNGDYEHAVLAQQAIDTARLTAAWDEYGDAVKKIQEDAQTKESAVDAQVKSGSLSKLSAEQKVFDLRKEEAHQLDELIKKEIALIEASDAPQAEKDRRLKALGLAKARNDAILSAMSPEAAHTKDTLDNSFQGGFTTFFDSVISHSKSAGEAIKNFGESIKSTFTKLISEQLGKSLFKSLFGDGGFGSSDGLLGGLFKGLFGSKSSGPNANADISMVNGGGGGGFLDSIGSFFSNMFSFDVGTDRVPQDMIAQIHKGEMIVPAYDAERLRSLKTGQANTAPPAVTLQIHPDVMHMTLSGWLEGEMARQLAHR